MTVAPRKRPDLSVALLFAFSVLFLFADVSPGQSTSAPEAEAVIERAVARLGGDKYLNVSSQIGRGRFSVLRDGVVISFQSFIDVIVYPDKERTEFKGGGVKNIQSNMNGSGWVYDGEMETVKPQTETQLDNFRRGIRSSLDHLLRGHWRGQAVLTYEGKRPATLGKRNDVIKLTYNDGQVVEFEIGSDDGIPAKAIQRRTNAEGTEVVEEDRYAQFVQIGGIRSPFIIDRFVDGVQTSRINYESVEYNKRIPDSIFAMPSNSKEARKDIKL